jgi:hypothetical protein
VAARSSCSGHDLLPRSSPPLSAFVAASGLNDCKPKSSKFPLIPDPGQLACNPTGICLRDSLLRKGVGHVFSGNHQERSLPIFANP